GERSVLERDPPAATEAEHQPPVGFVLVPVRRLGEFEAAGEMPLLQGMFSTFHPEFRSASACPGQAGCTRSSPPASRSSARAARARGRAAPARRAYRRATR